MKISENKNFKLRCKEFQNFTKEDVLKISSPKNYVHCTSFNRNSFFDEHTKVVICGTLTPQKGRDNGFFYSSPANSMFEILDSYFKSTNTQTNFVDIKNKIIKNPNCEKYINELQTELLKHKIALIDVVENAIASNIIASDDEIICFNLDYCTFAKVNKNVVYVCNSRNAEYALKLIAKHNNQSMKIEFAPQIWRKSKQLKQQRWNDVLKKYLK